jgi:hypothetical protein
LMKEVPKEAAKEPEIKKAASTPPAEEKPPAAEAKPEAKPEPTAEVKPAEVKPELRPVAVKPAEEKPAEEKPVEERPGVFPEVRSAGFVGDVNLRGIGVILENRDGKKLLSEGDIIYMAFRRAGPVMVGNKYTVFRPQKYVTHPVTKRKIGMKYVITGNVQVIDQQGNFFTGKIIEAFDAIMTGDMLRPYLKDK